MPFSAANLKESDAISIGWTKKNTVRAHFELTVLMKTGWE
jgi:hypothetical protein